MDKANFSIVNLCTLLISIFLLSDNWKIGATLREFGTKPVLGILTVILLIEFIQKKTLNVKVRNLLILGSIFFVTLFWLISDNFISLNQSILFLLSSAVVLFGLGQKINIHQIVKRLFVLHLSIFTIDIFFDISFLNDLISDVHNSNPKPRGLYTEHSWGCLVLGLSPLAFQEKRIIFYFLFAYTFFINALYLVSGTGILSSLICGFLYLSQTKDFNSISFRRLIIPIFLISAILFFGFSNRFDPNYNESNATRLLIPFYLLSSGLENYGLGIGLNGQVNFLVENYYSLLSFLSEFRNVAYNTNNNRFNSFNLYVRLWSSFGIFGLLISVLILKKLIKLILKSNWSIRALAAIALLSSLSNDSFNNSFLILILASKNETI